MTRLSNSPYVQALHMSDRAVSALGLGEHSPPIPTGQDLKQQIARELYARNAVLIAHYYVDGDLQDLALETGGCVADSLEMARFGRDHAARTLVVAGVRFMGETAKILSPAKRVLMPRLEATCSLDLGCPPDAFAAFCDAHPDRTVVVYANTSAAVKARADWMVTSSCAVAIVRHLQARGKKSCGPPTATSAATSRSRRVPTCCCGTAPASCTTSSRGWSWS